MANTGVRALDAAAQKAHEWLREIQSELGWEDEQMVFEATKAVLQTVRDRLPTDEAAQFAAQLPMLLKGAYYEGYDPGTIEKIAKPEEFYARVQRRTQQTIPADEATRGIMRVLERKMGGEMEDVRSNFPASLRDLWAQT